MYSQFYKIKFMNLPTISLFVICYQNHHQPWDAKTAIKYGALLDRLEKCLARRYSFKCQIDQPNPGAGHGRFNAELGINYF